MKREFLQNLKVGDQPLTKELIDAIMEENGRDIESAKKPFADYETIKEKLQTAEDGLKAFEGVDVNDLKGKITTLQGRLTTKDTEWQQKLRWKQAATEREEDGADVTDLTRFCTTDIERMKCPKDGCGTGIGVRCFIKCGQYY